MRTYTFALLLSFFVLFTNCVSLGQSTAAVGDLNGDGKLDLVVGNGSLNTVTVFLNDGTGNLSAVRFLAVSRQVQSVLLADFNQDGHLDVLVSEVSAPGLAFDLFLGDGTGAFAGPVAVPTGGLVADTGPVAADFNGDGLPDIAFSVLDTIEILFGDGHGGFSTPHLVRVFPQGNALFIHSLFVTDANNDGKPDLVINAEQTVIASQCFLAVNNGGASFSTAPVSLSVSDRGFFCQPVPDLNGDGHVDFISQFFSLYGDGQGRILYTQPRINSIKVADGLAVDFDHNATTDFVQARVQPNLIQYFPGNGHGGFGDPINVTVSNDQILAIGDFNGDGHADLVLQDVLNPALITVFLNNTVTPASIATASTTGITASATQATAATPVTLTASVSSLNAGGPSGAGTVTFTDGASTLGSAPVDAYGIAGLDFTFAAGQHNVNAVFNGALDPSTNTLFSASSTTSPVTVLVNPGAPAGAVPNVTLTTSLTPARQLNPVTFTASVTPSVAAAISPTGSVMFKADGDVLGVAPLSGTTAQLLTSFPAAGLHNIVAVYGGDFNFPQATSSTLVEDIRAFSATRNPSSVQVTASPFPNTPQTFVLSANVVGVSNPPSAFIYRVNGAFLALAPQPPPGPVLFAPQFQGTYTISAEYPGDAVLAPSTATTVLTVGNPGGDYSIAATPPNATIKAGQTATFTITITPQNGFSSTTSFSCSGLPAASACIFSPATLTPSGSPVSTTLTISTTAAQSAAVPLAGLRKHLRWTMLASFVVGLLLAGRLRTSTKARKLARVSAGLLLLCLLASCGGGSSPVNAKQVTPPGTSTITVSAAGTASHTIQLSLTVTP